MQSRQCIDIGCIGCNILLTDSYYHLDSGGTTYLTLPYLSVSGFLGFEACSPRSYRARDFRQDSISVRYRKPDGGPVRVQLQAAWKNTRAKAEVARCKAS